MQHEEEWLEDDGDAEGDLMICPSCAESVHEDTQQCPHCGDWIVPAYPQSRLKGWLWVIAVILMLLSMIMVAIR